jgi:hypothetical protein
LIAGGGVAVLVVVVVVVIHEKGGDVLDCGGEHCGVEGDGGKELDFGVVSSYFFAKRRGR